MKCTYNKNKRKLISGELKSVKWPFFKLLAFIDDCTQPTSFTEIDEDEENQENQQPPINGSENISILEVQPEIDIEVATTSKRWSVDEEVVLINFYRCNESLYNHKCETYRKAGKTIIMDRCSTELDSKFSRKTFCLYFYIQIIINICIFLSDSEIITKFKELRRIYFYNLKKVEESERSGTGIETVFEPTFCHFESLHFLRSTMDADNSVSFLDEEVMEIAQSEDEQTQVAQEEFTPEYTPKPPRGKRKKTADDLIETAMTTLEQLNKKNSTVAPKDICRTTGDLTEYTLNRVPLEIRDDCVGKVMKLLASFY